MEELVRMAHVYAADDSSHRLRDFNMTVFTGEFIFLAGLHGSGKHLVSRILTGDLIPDSGEFLINGELCRGQGKRFFAGNGIYSLEDTDCLVEEMSISEQEEPPRPDLPEENRHDRNPLPLKTAWDRPGSP